MEHLDLLLTLTGGLAASLVLGYLTHRIGLSPIVGYLLAGIAVGPHTPGFVANQDFAEQLAEIGVILLMFGVGLHFHLRELLAVRHVAIPGALGQSFVATLLGALVARAFGWDWSTGIVFGLAISVASTVVLVRVLSDNRDLHTPAGHVAVGWLVVEDLFTVVVLVLLPAVFGGAAGENDIVGASVTGIGGALRESGSAAGSNLLWICIEVAAKIGGLVAITFLVGGRLVPWLLEQVAATRSRELFTLTVLVVALGVAIGSAEVFGVSVALGAFLGGMVVGRSEFSLRAASEALPMRDAFAVLFFVSVGMLFDPSHLINSPGIVSATVGVILLGKPLAAIAIVWMLRYPPKVGLSVAVALAQIGEFSFMLALVASQLDIFPEAATNTLVAAAIVSIVVNPLLYRMVDPVMAWASRQPRLWRWLNARIPTDTPTKARRDDDDKPRDDPHDAIVVGYGPVGQTAVRLLRENDIEPTVVELNLETVRRLRQQGISAVYGDARHRDTLLSAGVETAGSLILAASEIGSIPEVIRIARDLNPDIHILARSIYVRDLAALRRAGAEMVFSAEGEVALAFTVAILRELGATPDQIDRERERVQAELLGTAKPSWFNDSPPDEPPDDDSVFDEPPAADTSPPADDDDLTATSTPSPDPQPTGE
jgi:CPA2 family monovalent cation:H+ antiporter-2